MEFILQQQRESCTLFLFYQGNKIKLIVFLPRRSRSICDVILIQNCRESISRLHPLDFRNADDLLSFWKGIGFIILILGAVYELYISVHATLTFIFLSCVYPIVSCVYPFLSCVYPIVYHVKVNVAGTVLPTWFVWCMPGRREDF